VNGSKGNEFPQGEPGGGFGDPTDRAGSGGSGDWFTPRRPASSADSPSASDPGQYPESPYAESPYAESPYAPSASGQSAPEQGPYDQNPYEPGSYDDPFAPRTVPNTGEPGSGTVWNARAETGGQAEPEWSAPSRPGGFSGASDPGGSRYGSTSPYGGSEGSPYGGNENPYSQDPAKDGFGGYRMTPARSESGPYESYNPRADQDRYGPAGGPGGGPGGKGPGGKGPGGGGPGGGGPGGGGGWGGGGDGEWANAPKPRRRRGRAAVMVPLAGAVGLVCLVGVGVYAFADSGGGCGGSDAINLKVAVAKEMAPAVNDTAQDFNSQKHDVAGKCVHASVYVADPAAVTTLLSGQGVSEGQTSQPDVWIPDSSLWADLVVSTPKGKNAVHPTNTSLAKTPLVVAMPKPLIERLAKTGILTSPSWDNLLTAAGGMPGGAVTKNQTLPANLIRLTVPDPVHTATGMSALMLTNELLASDPNKNTIFTGIVRTVQHAITPTVGAALTDFKPNARGQYPVALATEQAVWQHNQGNPPDPAVAVYPTEGSTMLDYPFEVTTADSTKAQAAALLQKAMSSANMQNRVRQLGFRTPDGQAPSSYGQATGVNPARPRELPEPNAGTAAQVMQAWAKLSLSIKMLTVFDVSNTMEAPVPNTNMIRLQALAKVAQGGLGLLSDDTEMGLWEFSSHMDGDKPYKPLISSGPLGQRVGSESRRDLIANGLAGMKVNKGSNTALYETLIAAYRYMKRTYEPDKINTVLIFTNGTDHLPGGLSIAQTVEQLKRLYDPDHPINVYFMGFGQNADRQELEQLTSGIEGGALIAQTPEEVQKLLLEAISKRICDPNCGGGTGN
jgi:hypothetical protein